MIESLFVVRLETRGLAISAGGIFIMMQKAVRLTQIEISGCILRICFDLLLIKLERFLVRFFGFVFLLMIVGSAITGVIYLIRWWLS